MSSVTSVFLIHHKNILFIMFLYLIYFIECQANFAKVISMINSIHYGFETLGSRNNQKYSSS